MAATRVGYFESWNLESLYGVLEAAEQCARADHHRV